MQHFILDADRRVVRSDLLAWGRWVGTLGNLEIARTDLTHLLVLTSFVGIDISFGEGNPAFFETKVLDGVDELECLEAITWDEALGRHRAATEQWRCWADAARDATWRAVGHR
jgi:hypothetical protein